MLFYLSLILVAIENGVIIPTSIWWLFGIDIIFKIIKAILEIVLDK